MTNHQSSISSDIPVNKLDQYSTSDSLPIPAAFGWFAKSFINATKPKKVLIPFTTGLERDFIDEKVNAEYCVGRVEIELDHFDKSKYKRARVLTEMPDAGVYDLILSVLPLGPISSNFFACQIVERSAKLLSEEGYCVFPFAKTIALYSAEKWLSKLEDEGLYCTAIIDMPTGSYAPQSMVETEIVVFSKKKAEKRFAGLLSDKEMADKIVDNYLKKKTSTKGPKLGIYVEGEIRCYSDYQNAARIQNKNKSLAKVFKGTPLAIKTIGSVHAPNKNNEFKENGNAVYVPKLGNSPVVTSISDFQIKAQNYFQIIVNPEIVLPRFLVFFLNSEEGVNLRQLSYRGATIKSFNVKALEDMVIPCPTIELQSEYLKTYDQLESLRVDIEALKDKLMKFPASYKRIRKEIRDINNTGDKFAQWIESLPYPIATILKRYSVADKPQDQQEMLFYFYEAYSIFEAAILSAALNRNLIESDRLNNIDPDYFEKASFGNWVRMDRTLSNVFLDAVNTSDDDKKKAVLECFKTNDENLIKLICDKSVCNTLEQASVHRNNWKGHTGITSEVLYEEHSRILGSLLTKLQESIKDLYERVRLVRPVSLTFSNGLFSNSVEVLTGSNPIFSKAKIESYKALDSSKLYIQIIDTKEMLELPPYFIMKNSPVDAKNACYFYSRVENGDTKYVSYHFEEKPEDIEAGEFVFDHIKQLLSN